MATSTGKGHRVVAMKGRSEFRHNGRCFKRDPATDRVIAGGPKQHTGVRNEK